MYTYIEINMMNTGLEKNSGWVPLYNLVGHRIGLAIDTVVKKFMEWLSRIQEIVLYAFCSVFHAEQYKTLGLCSYNTLWASSKLPDIYIFIYLFIRWFNS